MYIEMTMDMPNVVYRRTWPLFSIPVFAVALGRLSQITIGFAIEDSWCFLPPVLHPRVIFVSPSFSPPRVLKFVTHAAVKLHSGFGYQEGAIEGCKIQSSL